MPCPDSSARNIPCRQHFSKSRGGRDPDARGGTHYYMEPYQRTLGPRRCEVASMMEVGLGCDMHYDERVSARN